MVIERKFSARYLCENTLLVEKIIFVIVHI
jgi:hypothetical protein